VKAVSDLYSPVGGEVMEVNSEVAGDVSILNDDPYERGWLLKVRVGDLPADLLDHDAYEARIRDEAH
jgi:glycine cleavage system H protein